MAWKVKAITASGSIVTCTVQDASEDGARLAVPADATLPDRFHLYFPLRDQSHYVEVKWRSEGEVGIAYVDGLDAELRDLRSAIAHLTERLELLERATASRNPMLPLVRGVA